MNKKKLFFISSSIQFYENFLLKILLKLNNDYDVYLITNLSTQTIKFPNISLINLSISRNISPFKDLLCVFRLIKTLRLVKPDLIVSSSPKGLLILAIATLFYHCRRIHLLTGIIWSGKINKYKKKLYKLIDLILLYSCEKIFVDSPSQINFLYEENFYFNKLSLINDGSIQGVDLSKFKQLEDNITLRKLFNLKKTNMVLLFLGRISSEKGIFFFLDLVKNLRKKNNNIIGLIVGRDEKNIISNYQKKYSDFHKNFFYFSYSNFPEKYIQSCDIIIIPSKREGFCQVAIEASACGIPIVGFNVIGLEDSISNGLTGYLAPYGDIVSLEKKTKYLIDNPDIRKKMGKNGIMRVQKKFEQQKAMKGFVNQISSVIKG